VAAAGPPAAVRPPASSNGQPLVGAAPTPVVEGPFVHDNLALYLLRGVDRLELDGVLTLAQALDQGKVVVRETGDVGSLVIENLGDVGVFVEAGDIVKGGRQDRVLATDLVVPPRSGPLAIDAFCVESGRWSARPEEPSSHFASAQDALPARRLKVAARHEKDQGAVWAEVEKLQQRLAVAAEGPVTAAASATSLQLTLEHDAVRKGASRYVEALQPALERFSDAIGYAFAVNGEIVAADLYGAAELARKRGRKLLHAAAVEALAERNANDASTPPAAAAVGALLERAERSAAASLDDADVLDVLLDAELASYHLLESRGPSGAGAEPKKQMLHRALVLRPND
jgi:hypothetical protein